MLGRFRLLGAAGRGGSGRCLSGPGHRERLDRRPQGPAHRSGRAAPEVLRRFRKEARLLAEANNPHVVNLLEFNEEDSVPYLVLEFVAGKNV